MLLDLVTADKMLTFHLILQPVGFFRNNPSLDVPSGTDIKSVDAFKKPDTCCGKL